MSKAFTFERLPWKSRYFESELLTISATLVGTAVMTEGTMMTAPSVPWVSSLCEPKKTPRTGMSLRNGIPVTVCVVHSLRMPERTSDCPIFRVTFVNSFDVSRPGMAVPAIDAMRPETSASSLMSISF